MSHLEDLRQRRRKERMVGLRVTLSLLLIGLSAALTWVFGGPEIFMAVAGLLLALLFLTFLICVVVMCVREATAEDKSLKSSDFTAPIVHTDRGKPKPKWWLRVWPNRYAPGRSGKDHSAPIRRDST